MISTPCLQHGPIPFKILIKLYIKTKRKRKSRIKEGAKGAGAGRRRAQIEHHKEERKQTPRRGTLAG